MEQLSLLIKPASSSCNLKCRYCFYNDVSKNRHIENHGLMQEATMQKLIDRAFEYVKTGKIHFAFQGGEPTLATLSYFKNFINYVNGKKTKQQIQYSIQTNGIMIDENWATFFKENEFLVGISLDGFEGNHDYFRLDIQAKGTYHKVWESIELLQKHQVSFNVLCVLSNRLAKHSDALYEFLKEKKIAYVQFIPCLNDFENQNPHALSVNEFYQFYHTYFSLWLADFKQGYYQSVNLFDNLLLMLHDRPPYQCGMLGFCSLQMVIEADGSVYPCDFYVLDEYYCGNLHDTSFEEILNLQKKSSFFTDDIKPILCTSCPYENICHGGCKRMRHTFVNEKQCTYQKLLKEITPYLSQIKIEV